jgi:deazaflavin-dependent oxidoreductase (nitroreductase family)
MSTGQSPERKRRRVRWMQRYLLNPPMKLLAWAGLSPGHVLLETQGRRSAKRRRNVVGMTTAGDVGWVVAEQGRHAGWVRNVEAHANVRVRIGRRWRPARAEVAADDDPEARLDAFERRSHAAAVRRFGTELTTVRFDFDK